MFAGVSWSKGIEDSWSKVATFAPKILSFFVVLFIGSIIAKVLSKVVGRALSKARFDARLDKVGVGQHIEKLGWTPVQLVTRIIKTVVWWVVLTTAFGVFGAQNPVSKFLTSVINYVPKAVVAIVILGITAALARFVGDLVHRGAAAAKFPPVLAKIAPIAVWVIGVFAAVDQLGIARNVVSDLFRAILVVIAGSAVVAIGGGGITPMRSEWEKVLAKTKNI